MRWLMSLKRKALTELQNFGAVVRRSGRVKSREVCRWIEKLRSDLRNYAEWYYERRESQTRACTQHIMCAVEPSYDWSMLCNSEHKRQLAQLGRRAIERRQTAMVNFPCARSRMLQAVTM